MAKTPNNVTDFLREVEGVRKHAYQDSLGFWTIGVGRLIDERKKGSGLSDEEIDYLLHNDIEEVTRYLKQYQWFWDLQADQVRTAVVISMVFQLGSLQDWPNFRNAMENKDYDAAAYAMLNSKVAKEQTPKRWQRQALMMRTGEWV